MARAGDAAHRKIMLRVEQQSDGSFLVTVADERGQTQHKVAVRSEYAQKLTGGRIETRRLVEKSFEFLLAREAKEDILPEFDLSVIARYFPEYEAAIRKTLSS